MSHIVITWELGSHLGHIVRLLPLALKLRDSGHDVSFILKDLSRAYTLFVKHGFPVYQAPIWLHSLKDINSPPVYNLFDVDESFILTFPEFEHYPGRTNTRYWGPLTSNDNGVVPDWPKIDNKPKIFAYLKPEHGNLKSVLEAIAYIDAITLIYSSNIPESTVKKFTSENIRFSRKPYDIRAVARQCDLAICHAGHDTTLTVLLAGKPLLLLPMQQEQTLLCRNVAKLGAGLIGSSDSKREDYQQQIQQLLENKRYRESARQFSARYAGTQMENALPSVLKRCLELLQ